MGAGSERLWSNLSPAERDGVWGRPSAGWGGGFRARLARSAGVPVRASCALVVADGKAAGRGGRKMPWVVRAFPAVGRAERPQAVAPPCAARRGWFGAGVGQGAGTEVWFPAPFAGQVVGVG